MPQQFELLDMHDLRCMLFLLVHPLDMFLPPLVESTAVVACESLQGLLNTSLERLRYICSRSF